MRVQIERYADGGVAESLADDLRMNAGLQRQRGVRVTNVVEPDRDEAGGGDDTPELTGEPVGMDRPTNLVVPFLCTICARIASTSRQIVMQPPRKTS